MSGNSVVEELRIVVIAALTRKLGENGHRGVELSDSSDLLELGLIDSQDLIEVILAVERDSKREFDPAGLDLEGGLTIGKLIAAFPP